MLSIRTPLLGLALILIGALASAQLAGRQSRADLAPGTGGELVLIDEDFDGNGSTNTSPCRAWNNTQNLNDTPGGPCSAGDGIYGHGAWTTPAGGTTEIIESSECHGGAGRCLSHAVGEGTGSNGGGLKLNWGGTSETLYGCYWFKYSSGFSFRDSARTGTAEMPNFTKDAYGNLPAGVSHPRFTLGFHDNAWGIGVVQPGSNNPSNRQGWRTFTGGDNIADAKWVQVEFEVSIAGGRGLRRSRINGVVSENTTYNWGAAGKGLAWQGIVMGSNHVFVDTDANPATDAGPDGHIYYDRLYFARTRPTDGTAGTCGSIPMASPW